MTILVTGGAGFIGSNFILHWLEKNDVPVVNVDKLTYAGNLENLATLSENTNYQFVQADICDGERMLSLLLQHKITTIVHFAAESHVDRSISGPEDFIQTNIVGTFRLLEAARHYWNDLSVTEQQLFRFIHVSTDEVFGSLKKEEPAFNENSQYQPNSPYSASKAAADHLVRAYYHTYNLPVITSNCSNNYGPFQFPEKLIPLCIHNALAGKPIPIYGNGQQIRDWLYVKDHCEAICQIIKKGKIGDCYTIGGWNEKTNMSVVHEICNILDQLKPQPDGKSYLQQIVHVKDRPGHDVRYAIDASKIEQELGWQPAETFETGIKKTIEFYLTT